MASFNDYILRFGSQSEPFEALLTPGVKSDLTLLVNNVTYSVLVSQDHKNEVRTVLGSISLDSIQSAQDLTQRINAVSQHLKTNEKTSWMEQEISLKKNIGESYWQKKVVETPDNSHEGFLGFLRLNAQYEPALNHVLEPIASAIKANDKDKFLELFKSLPMGIVGMINHGEDLNAIPDSPALNPNKTIITESDLSALREYTVDSQFSGVVCLVDRTGIPHIISSNSQFNADTPFAIHSVAKMFTGMLAVKMIENGELSEVELSSPIQLNPEVMGLLESFLPNVKSHLTKEGAPSLHEIMLHQGGLGDYLDPYLEALKNQSATNVRLPQDFIQFGEDTIYEGTHYSNLGLIMVGLSIQHYYNTKHPSEKKIYHEILEEFVLKPAGVTSLTESRPEGGRFNAADSAAGLMIGNPAAGYWASAKDLIKFGEWVAKQGENPILQKYGGEFNPSPGEFSHGGETNSASSFLGTFLPNGITVAILSDRLLQAAVLEAAIKNHLLS